MYNNMFLICTITLTSLVLVSGTPPHSRIIGGADADIKSYPHQVSVQWLDMHICGGSIISEEYVITAAHCLLYKNPGDITIRTGTSTIETGGTVIGAKVLYVHSQFQRIDTSKYLFDIAIIKLSEALTFSNQVAAVALVDEGTELADDEDLVVIGWGATSEDAVDEYSKQLRMVVIQNIDLDRCRAVYDPDDLDIVDSDLCAGVRGGGKSFCSGDDGSPLFLSSSGLQDRKLYGVASWQIGCGEARYPGIYINIGHEAVRQFIKKITGL